MSILLRCPFMKSAGTKDITVCLFLCPKSRVLKCKEYEKHYPELLTFQIDPKYLERYGEVNIIIPAALRKRRRRRNINDGAVE